MRGYFKGNLSEVVSGEAYIIALLVFPSIGSKVSPSVLNGIV